MGFQPFPRHAPLRRMQSADTGIGKLKEHADTLIAIPNDRLLQLADKRASLQDAFRLADDVLHQGIQGISELITTPGLINLDFADVRAIMSEGGAALMAVGTGTGDERAKKAAEDAISSKLLDITIDGARGVLFNVTGGPGMTLFEVNQAAAIIRETSHPDVNMIFGAVIDPNMGDDIRITVIATGFERYAIPRRALERNTRENRRNMTAVQTRSIESVSVLADNQSDEANGISSQPSISRDDLDVPTFLRNRK
jgi:cell division protein FtsZ